MNEVAQQLVPFYDKLLGVTRRLDSLYRNGNTQLAPGYLDLRKEVDDERWRKVDAKLESIDNRLNNEKEQTIRDDERRLVNMENRDGENLKSAVRRDWWKWAIGLVIVIVLALGGWAVSIVLSDHYHWHVVSDAEKTKTTIDSDSQVRDADSSIK